MRALGQALLLHMALARPITDGPGQGHHLYWPGNLAERATYPQGQQGNDGRGSSDGRLVDRAKYYEGGQGAETRVHQLHQDSVDIIKKQLQQEATSRTWPSKKFKEDDYGFLDIFAFDEDEYFGTFEPDFLVKPRQKNVKSNSTKTNPISNNKKSSHGILSIPHFILNLFRPRKKKNRRKKKEEGKGNPSKMKRTKNERQRKKKMLEAKLKAEKSKKNGRKVETSKTSGRKVENSKKKSKTYRQQSGKKRGNRNKRENPHNSNNVVKQKPSPSEETTNPAADILPDFILDLLSWTSKSSDHKVESRQHPHSPKPRIDHDHEHVEDQ